MDYSTLKTMIASYAHRHDTSFTDRVPTFILLAQARMSRDLDTTLLHDTATLTVTAGTTTVTLPSDCVELMSVRLAYKSSFRLLQQHSLFNNSQIFESYSGSTSAPYYYARYGNTLELSPIPESNTTIDIIYKKKLSGLSDDTDTDAILTNYPNVYIYATMLEATPFLVDDERIDVWGNLYKEEINSINEKSADFEWSGAPLMMKNLGVDTP